MKNYKYIIAFILSAFVLIGCQDEDQELRDIITPTNISLSYEIVGQDQDNPNGDGDGFVNFTASADNALTYTYIFGDGSDRELATNGKSTHRFTKTGVNTYIVTVIAYGTGGQATSMSKEITVYSSFEDVEAENYLSGANIGGSKTWYWAASEPLHVGLGPVLDDYGSGEFAYEAWWNSIQPFDDEKSCMYSNKFVFTRTADGLTFEQTEGPSFIPGAYASELGIEGDKCYDETVATTMFGVKNISFFPSSSKAAVEGNYNGNPYRGTAFTISDGGFMGWYVGGSTYDIISISETEMRVRIIQPGDNYAWYHKFTTKNPYDNTPSFETQFSKLQWADEFNTHGAPDATKWTYDLGNGTNGWGNNEAQTYTNNAENVIVTNDVLKITAKADGNGGYTSARLKTQGLFNFTYGRVEVRAKLPAAQGTWPAIWMLGSNFPDVGWPQSGEIDIMEQTGATKNEVLGTLHWSDNGNNASASKTTAVTNSDTEFHNYTVEWREDKIFFLVDNEVYHEFDNNADLPFNQDFFMILNVAMGGTLGGTIDSNFTESSMEIDYVRVYQK